MRRSVRRLDALLARGGLSGPEKDRILDHVLARRARSAWRRPVLLWGGFTFAAAVTALVVMIPRMREASHFAVRGGTVQRPAIELEVACLGARLSACPAGSTLLFLVKGKSSAGYLSAWADPAGGGERIWYFSADGDSPHVRVTQREEGLSRGVRLGSEHAPGDYLVQLVLSGAPLDRQALRGPLAADKVEAQRVVPLTVVTP